MSKYSNYVDYIFEEEEPDGNGDYAYNLPQTIRVKYIGNMPKLEQEEGSDWIDLYLREDIILNKGAYFQLPLGIKTELPAGYEAYVVPRSSTFKRYGLLQTNHMAVIDNSYRGEWMMPVFATRDIILEKGTRLCQFRIQRNQPKIKFVEVNDVNHTNRDDGGFGSSGI